MSRKSARHLALALTLSSALSLGLGAPGAKAQEPTTQPQDTTTQSLIEQNKQLADDVRKLESRVDELEAKQQESAESRRTAEAVAKDAALRSEVIPPTALTMGYAPPNAGFVIHSEDGAFTLHPSALMDIRYMTSIRNGLSAGGSGEVVSHGGTDTQSGFDITRLRVLFDGTIYQNIGYFVQFQDDQGQSFGLLDAYATYHFVGTPFTLKAGQFKDPVWHERNLSEGKLMAVDRTYDEALLGGGVASRVQGVSLMYDKDRTRGQLAITDGYDSINSKFIESGGVGSGSTGGAGVTPTNFGVSGRLEYLAIGDRTPAFNPFTEYDQFTALGARQNILVLGGGFDYSQAGGNDVIFHSVDAQYDNTAGLGLYAAYLGTYRDLTTNQGVVPGNYYDPGFAVQASYLVLPKIEPFARFDYTYLDPGSVTGLKSHDTSELTLGANYYIHGQNVKFTLDGSYLPSGAPTDSDALGILKDSGRNEFVLRGQFQLAI
jgi:hypothetical protein